MSLMHFAPITGGQPLSREQEVAKELAGYLARNSGATTLRIAAGVLFARDDLIVCVGGDGGNLATAAGHQDWCAIVLLWNADRPARSRFNLVVQDNGRTEYFPDMRLLIDEAGRAQFVPSRRNGAAVMIGKSGPIPGANPSFTNENGWADAEQRALDVLFAHEDVELPRQDGADYALAEAGLRTFRKIARLWQLSADEEMKLMGPEATAVAEAERSSVSIPMTHGTLLRISAVLGIYAALESLLPGRSRHWIRQPNRAALFAGCPALQLMMSTSLDDLLDVRRYLDSQFA